MKRALVIIVTSMSLAAPAAGCGGNDSQSDDAVSRSDDVASANATDGRAGASAEGRSRRSTSRRKGASVKVRETRFGRILVDGRGYALYLFTRERTSESRCYGDCAKAWPPFLTKGKPRASDGAGATLIGTTKRRNGKTQATYNGHPLYYYVGDRKPGQVLCQAEEEFGGVWYVVSPDGNAIR